MRQLVLLATLIVYVAAFNCRFAPPVPREDDVTHPCNIKECHPDPFHQRCSEFSIHYCYEMGLGNSHPGCRMYSDKCNTLFNSARMPRLPVLRTGNFTQNATRNNSTSLARIALWPCLGDDCHDVFSQACMRKMMRHCAKDSSFAGCTILFDLCPFKPPLESYKSWVCLDNECTMNIRGKGCQDVMAKECSAMDLDDRPLICDAFLSKPIPQKDGETTLTEKWINAMTFPDPVAIEMTRIDNNKLAQLLPDLPVFGHYDFVGAPVSSVFTSNSADLTAPATGTPASEVAKPEVAHPEDADDESSSISSGVTLGGFQPGQFFPPPLAPLTPAVEIMEDFPDGIPRQRPPMFPSS